MGKQEVGIYVIVFQHVWYSNNIWQVAYCYCISGYVTCSEITDFCSELWLYQWNYEGLEPSGTA